MIAGTVDVVAALGIATVNRSIAVAALRSRSLGILSS